MFEANSPLFLRQTNQFAGSSEKFPTREESVNKYIKKISLFPKLSMLNTVMIHVSVLTE